MESKSNILFFIGALILSTHLVNCHLVYDFNEDDDGSLSGKMFRSFRFQRPGALGEPFPEWEGRTYDRNPRRPRIDPFDKMDEDIANFNDDDDIYRFGVAVNNRLGPKLMPGKKLGPRAFRSRNLGKLKFVKNHGFLFNQDVDDDNEPGRRVDKLFESFGF